MLTKSAVRGGVGEVCFQPSSTFSATW